MRDCYDWLAFKWYFVHVLKLMILVNICHFCPFPSAIPFLIASLFCFDGTINQWHDGSWPKPGGWKAFTFLGRVMWWPQWLALCILAALPAVTIHQGLPLFFSWVAQVLHFLGLFILLLLLFFFHSVNYPIFFPCFLFLFLFA